MKMRFLLDEHLPRDLITAVKQLDADIDITLVGDPDAPARGTKDPDILIDCEIQRRALVTNNRKSMPHHEADHFVGGRHHWGIFQVRPGSSVADLADTILFLWQQSQAEEWQDLSDWIPW